MVYIIAAANLAGRRCSEFAPSSPRAPKPQEEIRMKKVERIVVCALFVIAARLATGSASAQSPLDGTWRTQLNQTKFSPKPLASYLSQGWYHCVSCSPSF